MSRGRTWSVLVVGVLVSALAACTAGATGPTAPTATASASPSSASTSSAPSSPTVSASPSRPSNLIGDGSTSRTGAQPRQRTFEPLAPGALPPQFVVFSWDGAGEGSNGLLKHFSDLGVEKNANMTFFLSGIYLLPESRRAEYHPPGRDAGASAIGFLDDESVRMTITGVGEAWRAGHEIGTHFNGHFCGQGGAASWSTADWTQDLAEAKRLVKNWRTLTGWTDLPPLPFDYDEELIGGRAPCLEGQEALIPAEVAAGFRYDTSGVRLAVWPAKKESLWDISMTMVPMAGRKMEIVPMDYNFMVQQSGKSTQGGDAATRVRWKKQVKDSLLAGVARSQRGNRAPVIIGNHFNHWNGGIYMDAVTEVISELATDPDVHLVSFRELTNWLDVQNPALLTQLQGLATGQKASVGAP